MMIFLRNSCFIFLSVAFLMGCKKELTSSYLLQHPQVLKQEVTHCQLMGQKTAEQEARCRIVMDAAVDLTMMLNKQQEDPEKFGQQLLDTEIACIKLKNEWQKGEQHIASLKAKQASVAELKAAQTDLDKVREQYHQQHEDIKNMLAIIGLSSPE